MSSISESTKKQNLTAAYRCYGRIHEFMMQIVMALNGEGVVRDVKRVDDLFARWQAYDRRTAYSDYAQPIRDAIASLHARKPLSRLDFCSRIAAGTIDGIRCDRSREFRLERDLNEVLDGIEHGLAAGTPRERFMELRRAFRAFADAEEGRGFQLFIRGTIRNSAGALLRNHIRSHFLEHARTIFRESKLDAASDVRLRDAERELERVASTDLIRQLKEEEAGIGIGQGYRKAAETSHDAWLNYRNAWVESVKTITFPYMTRAEAETAVKTLLTRERIGELQHNILGVQ
jgi:hypothetical protein